MTRLSWRWPVAVTVLGVTLGTEWRWVNSALRLLLVLALAATVVAWTWRGWQRRAARWAAVAAIAASLVLALALHAPATVLLLGIALVLVAPVLEAERAT